VSTAFTSNDDGVPSSGVFVVTVLMASGISTGLAHGARIIGTFEGYSGFFHTKFNPPQPNFLRT
jgi:hypothetical protein